MIQQLRQWGISLCAMGIFVSICFSGCARFSLSNQPLSEIQDSNLAHPKSTSDFKEPDVMNLFAIAETAFNVKDFNTAIPILTKIVDDYPNHPIFMDAACRLAEAYKQLGDDERVEAIYRSLLEKNDWHHADQQRNRVYFEMGRFMESAQHWDKAISLYQEMMADQTLDEMSKIEAHARMGISFYHAGFFDRAKNTIDEALARFELFEMKGFFTHLSSMAQAQFVLGEICFKYFENISLATQGDDLDQNLTWKIKMLVAARDYYLKVAEKNEPFWQTAALYRIGLTYDVLYKSIIEAPLPEGLTSEEQNAYRQELSQTVEGIWRKAITTYQKTLEFALDHQINNEWVELTRLNLSRLMYKSDFF